MGGEKKKIFGRGANECKMCGRKQGLVRPPPPPPPPPPPREWAQKMGFKKMN